MTGTTSKERDIPGLEQNINYRTDRGLRKQDRLISSRQWRSIPAELGDWRHAYLRYRRWAVSGVWDRIMAHVVAEAKPKLAFARIDGTVAQAHQKATGARANKPTRRVCDSIAGKAATGGRAGGPAVV